LPDFAHSGSPLGEQQASNAQLAEALLAYMRARVPQLTHNQQTPTCPLIYDFGEAYLLARVR
jgi:hypothetical protein